MALDYANPGDHSQGGRGRQLGGGSSFAGLRFPGRNDGRTSAKLSRAVSTRSQEFIELLDAQPSLPQDTSQRSPV